eukprot:Phypoly_transcript_08618.p1 GENE.Phypoly_transcript_08618~~Phypoly_transcript_08618.p1  ORF type:complete len:332 (+),score=21.32 Phypoly_transcript_08618:86-1081(+)
MSLHTRSTHQRWADIEKQVPEAKEAKKVLYDSITEEQDARKVYSKNIENFVGTVKVPLGVVGPLKVKTSLLTREYYIPLATTEAALLASIGRGCKTLSLAGGVTSRVVDQRVQRAPRFEFGTIDQAIKFEKWISSPEMLPKFQEVASTTTRHGKIINIKPFIQGNHVSVKFEFSTGEAIGQNMVSIASQQVVNFIRKQNPEGLTFSVLEGGTPFLSFSPPSSRVRVLRVTCCVLLVACCVLHVACCVLHVACCVLHLASCVLLCFALLTSFLQDICFFKLTSLSLRTWIRQTRHVRCATARQRKEGGSRMHHTKRIRREGPESYHRYYCEV